MGGDAFPGNGSPKINKDHEIVKSDESHPIPLTLWIPFSTMCVRGEKARRYGERIVEIHR